MGENFMGRSNEIQHRANCFVIQIIGSAEMQIRHAFGMPLLTSEYGDLYERARMLLLLAPSVSPARENSTDSRSDAPVVGPFTSMVPGGDAPVLFRSHTTKAGIIITATFFCNLAYLITFSHRYLL